MAREKDWTEKTWAECDGGEKFCKVFDFCAKAFLVVFVLPLFCLVKKK